MCVGSEILRGSDQVGRSRRRLNSWWKPCGCPQRTCGRVQLALSPSRPRGYSRGMINDDPVQTNPDHYRILWENDFVRVLVYADLPGERTTPHDHPNSVMVTLSSFSRKLSAGDRVFETELQEGQAVWIPAQRHAGENTGATPTHTILVELKGAAAGKISSGPLGPAQ